MLLLAAAPTFAFALPAWLSWSVHGQHPVSHGFDRHRPGRRQEGDARQDLALQTVVIGGGGLIGGPLLGWLADVAGGRVPIVLGGVVCLLAAAFGYLANRRYVHRTAIDRGTRRDAPV